MCTVVYKGWQKIHGLTICISYNLAYLWLVYKYHFLTLRDPNPCNRCHQPSSSLPCHHLVPSSQIDVINPLPTVVQHSFSSRKPLISSLWTHTNSLPPKLFHQSPSFPKSQHWHNHLPPSPIIVFFSSPTPNPPKC